MKIFIIAISAVFLAGCSYFTINGSMCDQVMSDPNSMNIPKECKAYDEKKAKEASVVKKDDEISKKEMDRIIEEQKAKDNLDKDLEIK